MLRFTTLFSIMCALLVKTRFDSFLSVCVKFLDASASAGLSVLMNVSFDTSIDDDDFCVVTCDGGCCCCDFGFITTLELDADDDAEDVEGRWWNGIKRGIDDEAAADVEQHGSSTTFERCSLQLLLQLMLRRLHRHDVKFAEIGSTATIGGL